MKNTARLRVKVEKSFVGKTSIKINRIKIVPKTKIKLNKKILFNFFETLKNNGKANKNNNLKKEELIPLEIK